ncbi:MAG: hypothetical protein MJ211_15740 [Bacteroidales bacterium]|nr:hypothetical protein [Bacteroidales bacterium]
MKNKVLLFIFLLLPIVLKAQNTLFDSLYMTRIDTIVKGEKFEKLQIWKIVENQKYSIFEHVFVKHRKMKYQNNCHLAPKICKIAYNYFDSIVYLLEFTSPNLVIYKVNLEGTINDIDDNPYPNPSKEFDDYVDERILPRSKELDYRIYYNYEKFKDIDYCIKNNIMTLKCYEYHPAILSFQYDFNTKEWTILEDRKLTEEEIFECGLYESDN